MLWPCAVAPKITQTGHLASLEVETGMVVQSQLWIWTPTEIANEVVNAYPCSQFFF